MRSGCFFQRMFFRNDDGRSTKSRSSDIRYNAACHLVYRETHVPDHPSRVFHTAHARRPAPAKPWEEPDGGIIQESRFGAGGSMFWTSEVCCCRLRPALGEGERLKILIVSYQFPPMGGVGVQRALSFARYLPECGFEEVHVLRAWNGVSAVSDPGLVRHIPSGVKVHDAFTPELPFRFRQQLWKLFSGGARPQRTNTVDGNGTLNWRRVPVEIARRVFCPEPEVVWVPFALRRARKIVKQYGTQTTSGS